MTTWPLRDFFSFYSMRWHYHGILSLNADRNSITISRRMFGYCRYRVTVRGTVITCLGPSLLLTRASSVHLIQVSVECWSALVVAYPTSTVPEVILSWRILSYGSRRPQQRPWCKRHVKSKISASPSKIPQAYYSDDRLQLLISVSCVWRHSVPSSIIWYGWRAFWREVWRRTNMITGVAVYSGALKGKGIGSGFI